MKKAKSAEWPQDTPPTHTHICTCVYIYIAYKLIMVIKVYEYYNKNTIILGSSFSVPTCQYDPNGSDRKQEP